MFVYFTFYTQIIENMYKENDTIIRHIDLQKTKEVQSIGILSDLHIGSNYFDLNEFKLYLDEITLRKITTIVCAGDFFEFNDLDQKFVSQEKYLENTKEVLKLLVDYKIKIISVKGNHDVSLQNKFPDFFDLLVKLFEKVVQFTQTDCTTFTINGHKIAVGHYYNQAQKNTSLTLGGHTHATNHTGTFINPGTFRKHFKENVQTGGLILQATATNLSIIPVGETERNSQIKKTLLNLGKYPEIIPLNNESSIHYKKIIDELRKVDRHCVMWITGSSVIGCTNKDFGSLKRRYKIENIEKNFLLSQDEDPSYNVFVPLSDWDIEIVSDKITKKDVHTIFENLYKNGDIPTPIRRIEIICYRPDEIIQYFQIGSSAVDHNYFTYRMLMSPKSCVDELSQRILIQYIDQAIFHFNHMLQKNGTPITEDLTFKVSDSYRHFKKHFREMMKGELTPTLISPLNPSYDYVKLKNKPNVLGVPPYYFPHKGSFKVELPRLEILEQKNQEEKHKIVAPPLSAYTSELHMGQALSVFIGMLLSRFYSSHFDPYTFQSTGPYWDRTNIDSKQIPQEILNNQEIIKTKLSGFGIDGEVYSDDHDKNIEIINYIIDIWLKIGLLLKTDRGLSLKIGAALTFFGSQEIFNRISDTRLLSTLTRYINTDQNVEMYPIHGQSTKYPFLSSEGELYPTFSILGLPHINSASKLTIFSGVNVATQFGLPHAIFAKSMNPTTTIDFTALQLITDSSGKRLSRLNNTLPNLDDLTTQVKSAAREKYHSEAKDEAIKFAVIFGLLALSTSKTSRKIDINLFLEGLKVFTTLERVKVFMNRNNITVNSLTFKDPSLISEKIRKSIENFEFDKVTNHLVTVANSVSQKIHKKELSIDEIQEFLTLIWLVGGEWAVTMSKLT